MIHLNVFLSLSLLNKSLQEKSEKWIFISIYMFMVIIESNSSCFIFNSCNQAWVWAWRPQWRCSSPCSWLFASLPSQMREEMDVWVPLLCPLAFLSPWATWWGWEILKTFEHFFLQVFFEQAHQKLRCSSRCTTPEPAWTQPGLLLLLLSWGILLTIG